jgi:hypothetical protein
MAHDLLTTRTAICGLLTMSFIIVNNILMRRRFAMAHDLFVTTHSKYQPNIHNMLYHLCTQK